MVSVISQYGGGCTQKGADALWRLSGGCGQTQLVTWYRQLYCIVYVLHSELSHGQN